MHLACFYRFAVTKAEIELKEFTIPSVMISVEFTAALWIKWINPQQLTHFNSLLAAVLRHIQENLKKTDHRIGAARYIYIKNKRKETGISSFFFFSAIYTAMNIFCHDETMQEMPPHNMQLIIIIIVLVTLKVYTLVKTNKSTPLLLPQLVRPSAVSLSVWGWEVLGTNNTFLYKLSKASSVSQLCYLHVNIYTFTYAFLTMSKQMPNLW